MVRYKNYWAQGGMSGFGDAASDAELADAGLQPDSLSVLQSGAHWGPNAAPMLSIPVGGGSQSISSWAQQNWQLLLIGAVAGMVFFGSGRHR